MKIAIVGATGTSGRATAHAAQQAGHEVIALSRATGVDLHTGAGLAEGIQGADVVIDTSNAFPTSPQADLVTTFAEATERLVSACEQAEVQHLVHLSICNIDAPAFDEFDYYLAKRAQERMLDKADLPHSVIRSAQWMEFALNPAAVTQAETEVRVGDWLIQPIAVASVAEVLVQAATVGPANRQVAGLEQIRLPDLTQALLNATGDTRPVIPTSPTPKELANGILLAPAEAELFGPTVSEWVDDQHNRP